MLNIIRIYMFFVLTLHKSYPESCCRNREYLNYQHIIMPVEANLHTMNKQYVFQHNICNAPTVQQANKINKMGSVWTGWGDGIALNTNIFEEDIKPITVSTKYRIWETPLITFFDKLTDMEGIIIKAPNAKKDKQGTGI